MQVILLQRVINLGNVGDQVNVRPGFARNFLFPQKKAIQANENNLVYFEKRRAELEKQAEEVLSAARARAASFENYQINLQVQASEEGKLFGSIGPRDIAKASADAGKLLEKSEIEMPEGPIRTVGEFSVTAHLHGEVQVKIKVVVAAL